MKTKYLQQGDVLMFPVKELPEGVEKQPTNVLQEGEHTGHAHRLMFRHDDKAIGSGVYQHPMTLKKYFEVEVPTDLNHEEHKTIQVPPGIYEVRIVREYDHFENEAREVVD